MEETKVEEGVSEEETPAGSELDTENQESE